MSSTASSNAPPTDGKIRQKPTCLGRFSLSLFRVRSARSLRCASAPKWYDSEQSDRSGGQKRLSSARADWLIAVGQSKLGDTLGILALVVISHSLFNPFMLGFFFS